MKEKINKYLAKIKGFLPALVEIRAGDFVNYGTFFAALLILFLTVTERCEREPLSPVLIIEESSEALDSLIVRKKEFEEYKKNDSIRFYNYEKRTQKADSISRDSLVYWIREKHVRAVGK